MFCRGQTRKHSFLPLMRTSRSWQRAALGTWMELSSVCLVCSLNFTPSTGRSKALYATYCKMFERLSYAILFGLFLQPTELLTDCEAVIRNMMPIASHRLCYFHLCQANYRFATEACRLTIPYHEDAEVQGLLRRV